LAGFEVTAEAVGGLLWSVQSLSITTKKCGGYWWGHPVNNVHSPWYMIALSLSAKVRGMTQDEVVQALKKRYGVDRAKLHDVVTGDVEIGLPVSEWAEDLRPYILTFQQAKYLVANPVPDGDLRANKLPPDWPSSPNR